MAHWKFEKVTNFGETSSYARASTALIQNYRCIAYSSVGSSNFLGFARKVGDEWVDEIVESSSDIYAKPTVFEYDGIPHIGYVRTDGVTGSLYIARRNANETWSVESIYVSANQLTAAKFAKNSKGLLAATTTEYNSVSGNVILKYHEHDGNNWSEATIATIASEAQEDIDLAFIGDRPYVVYSSGVSSSTPHRMYYRQSESWTFALIDAATGIMGASVVNVGGSIYVVYSYKSGANYILRARLFSNGSFGTTTTLGTSTSSAFGSEVDAASVAGKLFVFSRGSDGEGDMYILDGGVTTTDTNFVDGSVRYVSIDESAGDLYLAFYSGGVWSGVYTNADDCDLTACENADGEYSPYCEFVTPMLDEYTAVHGSKWYYSQNMPGSPWYDKVSNARGWTVDFNLQVHAIENANGAADFGDPGAIGIYVNDGKRFESIYFLEQEVVFKNAQQSFIFDTTAPTHYRLIGKDDVLKLFARREGAREYIKVAEANYSGMASSEGNAGRPSVAQDSEGAVHAVWQDDGDGNGQIFYGKYDNGIWSSPQLIVSNEFGASNPCIVLDSNDRPHVVYETKESAGSSVAMVYLAEGEWSEKQYVATRGASAPKAAKDSQGNIQIVWQDNSSGRFEIHRNVWNVNTLSMMGEDTVASGSYDIALPAIAIYLDRIYVAYVKYAADGSGRVYGKYYSRSAGTWSSEVAISASDSELPGALDAVADHSGAIMFVWHDNKGGEFEIYARRFNPSFAAMGAEVQVTNSGVSAKYPSISRHATNGRLYVAWEDERESEGSHHISKIYLAYYDPSSSNWQSSNQGHFDVNIEPADDRFCFRPALPKFAQGELHIMHEGQMASRYDEYLSVSDLFKGAFDTIYTLVDVETYIPQDDEYEDRDWQVSGRLNRKELRFGSFSDTVAGKVSFKYIKLYLQDAVSPFNIIAVAPEFYGLDSLFSTDVAVNNYGNAWLGSLCGGYFYYNEDSSLMPANIGAENSSVTAIVFDRNNTIYVALSTGEIFKSADHFTYASIGTTNNRVSAMSVDSRNRLWIATNNGVYTYETSIAQSDISLPSDNATAIVVDSADIVWVGTDSGLVRYANGRSLTFNARSGMSSSRVNDIAIRNSAIRYIATSSGIDKMVGTSFEPITSSDGTLWNDNVKSVAWREPNVLFAGTLSRITQIVEREDGTYISKAFSPQEFTTQEAELDDRQIFYIVTDGDTIDENAIVEVYLNGNRIDQGYSVSLGGDQKLLRFETPLLDTDKVDVIVRNDIELLTSFAQTDEERSSLGGNLIRIKSIEVIDDKLYVATTGDTKAVYCNDATLPYPFDVANIDTTPPDGCLSIAEQVDSSTIRVEIDLPEGSDTYDAGSGIDKMIISDYPNFTTDGTTPQAPVPFLPSVLHVLPPTKGIASTSLSITSGSGSKLAYIPETGDVLAATNTPAAIYKFDRLESEWTLVKSFGNDEYVDFIAYFNNRIYVSIGHVSNTAKLYNFNDSNFSGSSNRALSGTRAQAYAVIGNFMYIGTNVGNVHQFDGTSLTTLFSDVGSSVYSLVAVRSNLMAGTGESGLVYLLDLDDEASIIRHSDTDAAILSAAVLESSDNTMVFFGTNTEGKVIRTNADGELYNKSFQTTPNAVRSLKVFGDSLYAAIGDEVYSFSSSGAWVWQYTHSEDVQDIMVINDQMYVISLSKIVQIDNSETERRIYLKLIDRAGNETSLFDSDGNLIPCHFAAISIQDLQGFVSENRVLEVDELGNTIYSLTGDAPFYSANRIDQEVGEYESQVLDGTGDLLRWDSMSWTATESADTQVLMYVRASDSRNDIVAEKWMGPFSTADLPIVNLDFVNGRYLQFKAVLISKSRGVSPTLEQVVIRTITAESIEFFTTNFALPSEMRHGLFVAQDMVPVEGKIVYGVSTTDSVNWLDYQEIEPNRVFSFENFGANLRVGIRLRSPSHSIMTPSDFDEYGPYNTEVFVNTIDFEHVNSGPTADFQFRITLYSDPNLTNKVYEADTLINSEDFSVNGAAFPSGGITMTPLQSASILFSLPGTAAINCNQFYYVKVEAYTNSATEVIIDDRSFVAGCSASFIDNIDFTFKNTTGEVGEFHFRIRFYLDGERTNLFKTFLSANDRTGWSVDGVPMTEAGEPVNEGENINVSFAPDLSLFEPNTIYYLTIDAFDGSAFTLASNSYTFLASDSDELIYCGPYIGVPVVKNFGIIFSMANFKEKKLNK